MVQRFSPELFGRGIGKAAQQGMDSRNGRQTTRSRQAKIRDFELPSPIEHEVLRREITMEKVESLMRHLQGISDLSRIGRSQVWRKTAIQV